MEYRKVRDDYVVRIDKGEELLERLAKFASIEDIGCASICGIGASDDFSVSVFDADSKTYAPKSYKGYFEIASLNGNITRKDSKPYLHLHGVFANAEGVVAAGHITKATIGATCEVFVHALDGEVGREMSEEIGINTMRFQNG